MLSPFSVVVDQVYPVLNAKVARDLTTSGMRQAAIAKYLGITQAMVSRYLEKNYALDRGLDRALEESAGRICSAITSEEPKAQIARLVADETLALIASGVLDSLFKEKLGASGNAFRDIGQKKDRTQFKRQFQKATDMLEQTDISVFLPEIGINLAAAPQDAKGKQDVLSLPGKLLEMDGSLKAVTEPRFGCSNYLASMLLAVQAKNPSIGAILNIQYNSRTKKIFSSNGWRGLTLEQLKRYDGSRLDYLLEKAAPGIEPNAYILGKDALDVVRKVRSL